MPVKTNVTKVIREFDSSLTALYNEIGQIEASLAVKVMDDIRERGLIQGEQNKSQYLNFKRKETGMIVQRRSQKYRTKDRNRYKYYGNVRNRENKYAPRDRGEPRVRIVFHKKKMAVRSGNFYKVFATKKSFHKTATAMIQNRYNSKIMIEKIQNKDRTRKLSFAFDGPEGKALLLKSYGQKRIQPLRLDNGKEVFGRKGKRDIVANNIRRVFNTHNKIIQKHIDTDYLKRFNKIG